MTKEEILEARSAYHRIAYTSDGDYDDDAIVKDFFSKLLEEAEKWKV